MSFFFCRGYVFVDVDEVFVLPLECFYGVSYAERCVDGPFAVCVFLSDVCYGINVLLVDFFPVVVFVAFVLFCAGGEAGDDYGQGEI